MNDDLIIPRENAINSEMLRGHKMPSSEERGATRDPQTYIYIYINIYVYIYVNIYICIHMYIYLYICK